MHRVLPSIDQAAASGLGIALGADRLQGAFICIVARMFCARKRRLSPQSASHLSRVCTIGAAGHGVDMVCLVKSLNASSGPVTDLAWYSAEACTRRSCPLAGSNPHGRLMH